MCVERFSCFVFFVFFSYVCVCVCDVCVREREGERERERVLMYMYTCSLWLEPMVFVACVANGAIRVCSEWHPRAWSGSGTRVHGVAPACMEWHPRAWGGTRVHAVAPACMREVAPTCMEWHPRAWGGTLAWSWSAAPACPPHACSSDFCLPPPTANFSLSLFFSFLEVP